MLDHRMPIAYYTIGHSTHGIEEFVGLLRQECSRELRTDRAYHVVTLTAS
jgi:hypothetical protein